jgi:3-deoxy-7-phosphoheptulonate synthase
MTTPWKPSSWREKPISQHPSYPDTPAFQRVAAKIAESPPLVSPEDTRKLTQHLVDVAQGDALLLQGGD